MSAKDVYHNAVESALIEEGWNITADPYKIAYKDAELYADLATEPPIAAERNGQKIVVVIESFVGHSPMQDFHSAIGQYVICRQLITLTEPEYELYMAIDDITYENFFIRKSMLGVIEENNMLLLVVDIEQEKIVQWKN
ncbi:MAG: XisH family protein [Cyanobacteriota bacterium]|nr:XisH family protein [Cyanobacteriota bacterium]